MIFAFRVGNNGYSADIIVGTTKSNVAVLYDIVNLESKKIEDASDTAQDRRHETSSNITIPQTDEKSQEKFSTRDAEYLELAKEPEKNKDKLQEMVDEAAEENGYNIKAYHGTTNQETTETWNDKTKTYDKEYTPIRVFKTQSPEQAGHFFNDDIDNAGGYGSYLYSVYLKINNPLIIDCKGQNYSDISFDNKSMDTYEWASYAKRKRYDGVIFNNISDGVGYDDLSKLSTDYVAFYPEQIKSADLVTYDDNGEIIPLSERFNDSENDIRFSSRDYSNLDEFDKNDYTEIELPKHIFNKLYSEALTWDADKVGQVCQKFLFGTRFVYYLDSNYELHIILEEKSQNIHERDEYKQNAIRNREVFDKVLGEFESKRRNNRHSVDISQDGRTTGENDKHYNQETRAERRSDGTGYTESGNNADSREENEEVKTQTRNTDGLDNRTLLANALETVAKNDVEQDYLASYKKITHEINEKQEQLGEYRRQIKIWLYHRKHSISINFLLSQKNKSRINLSYFFISTFIEFIKALNQVDFTYLK